MSEAIKSAQTASYIENMRKGLIPYHQPVEISILGAFQTYRELDYTALQENFHANPTIARGIALFEAELPIEDQHILVQDNQQALFERLKPLLDASKFAYREAVDIFKHLVEEGRLSLEGVKPVLQTIISTYVDRGSTIEDAFQGWLAVMDCDTDLAKLSQDARAQFIEEAMRILPAKDPRRAITVFNTLSPVQKMYHMRNILKAYYAVGGEDEAKNFVNSLSTELKTTTITAADVGRERIRKEYQSAEDVARESHLFTGLEESGLSADEIAIYWLNKRGDLLREIASLAHMDIEDVMETVYWSFVEKQNGRNFFRKPLVHTSEDIKEDNTQEWITSEEADKRVVERVRSLEELVHHFRYGNTTKRTAVTQKLKEIKQEIQKRNPVYQ